MDNDLTHFEPNGNTDFMNKFKFFQVPKQNKTIENVFESVYYPQIPITDNTKEIEIKIDAQEFFIDLSNTYVTFDVTVLRENGQKLPPILRGTKTTTTTTTTTTQNSTFVTPTNLVASTNENQRKRKRNDSEDSENDDETQYKKKKN